MLIELNQKIVSWLDSIPAESVWITSVTLFEAYFGLALLPQGKRRSSLEKLFKELLEKDLEGRVLLFDLFSAEQAANLAANRQHNGRIIYMRDTFIAGITLSKNATLVTRNIRHFSDLNLNVINP